ncbi:MAG: aconitase X catalytic domain-containing protein [Methanomicrobiaceae archaeon]|uniref:Phosphomevalonate dehydratase large subunit-like domain-containing protein n=1 Tax=hydrocarbon metagenome TaxID=938273 RepID=A0A0W8FK45_9ZZZZ|nr:aconitase X catalytic domain-containing protein [Methanomicrobiaceae archaeon]MDD5419324.1 aconitase X catalytic domain-containing protein [Methanomicrobiaceae archaeon]
MYLDTEDEAILNGEYGETRQRMMEILVALGRVYGAERLVPIASAQVSGASYKTIGEWGLAWLQGLNARVAVPSVLNPIGMPRDGWQDIGGITTDFAEKQLEVLEAYRRLGVAAECTCTPYYLQNTVYGEHLAWSESSAVVYANSVIGARTNREGGPSALAAAIIGKTPFYGLHIVAERRPQVVIEVEGTPHYGALGYLAGKQVGAKIPFFTGIRPTRDQLKALGAAMAATGAVALFHVDRITPETRIFSFETEHLGHIAIGQEEIDGLFSDIEVDAVAVGCPHCSPAELEALADLLSGRKTTKPFFIFASRSVIAANRALVAAIERSGARVVADTCMVVSPAMDRFSSIMVDSGKALAYVPGMCGAAARIGTREECVAVATDRA